MMYHIITNADTLEKLSAQYRVPICMIIRANMSTMENLLQPGRRVVIPPPFYCVRIEKEAMLENYGEVFSIKRYSIKQGDTVFSIAQKFSTTIGRIVGANGFCKIEDFFPGKEVLVPCLKKGFAIYSLKPHDSIDMVAARFGMGMEELSRYNCISEGVYPGMQLIVKARKRAML